MTSCSSSSISIHTFGFDLPPSTKLASPRGQSCTIIAPQKPTSLPLSGGAQHEAQKRTGGNDTVISKTEANTVPSAVSITTLPSSYTSNSFASCKAFLSSAESIAPTQVPIRLPCSKSLSNIGATLRQEKGCVTEVHSGSTSTNTTGTEPCIQEDEVEILSLLEEKIPKYKLRADCLTKFSGYQNDDFCGIPYPVLQDFSPVTPEQAYLTLGYFLLSGNRVSQMTKTYSDVDCVQRLLEEKEKDLELAARIGQQLLEQNQILQEKVTSLENENKENQESITQLKHELAHKSQLLELYSDNCHSEESSKAGTPIGGVATLLERRVTLLEDENRHLRNEACRITEIVEQTEAEEKYLVDDAIRRLGETNARMNQLSDELDKKNEEHVSQQEEILMLIDEVKSMQELNKELFEDNAQLQEAVTILKSSQNELSTELIDLRDNYVEVVTILKETQEQLKDAQKRKESGDMDVISVFDSLAFELENSVAKQRRSSDYFRRCFDTVRSANHKFSDTLSMCSSNMMSLTGSSGYHSGLPSLESSSNIEMFQNNPPCLSITGSDLDSSLSMCHSPGGASTPSDKFSWRLPEKLQIVKPLEGSSTLQIWSTLATPHLGSLLEKRPGIQMRAERRLSTITKTTLCYAVADKDSTLQNCNATPTVFTFVTTTTNWNRRRDSTTTVFSQDFSSILSTCSSTSSNNSPLSSSQPFTSVEVMNPSYTKYSNDDLLEKSLMHLKCETPQNSPDEGNSRSSTPSDASLQNRSFKTIYNMYDSLVTKLSNLGSSAPSTDCTNSQKYNQSGCREPDTELQRTRERAPVKPGSGVLDDILSK